MKKPRNRQPLSCSECQRKKQKCDRSLPCSNCTSRGKEVLCCYEKKVATSRSATAVTNSTFALKAQEARNKPLRLSDVAASWGYATTETSTTRLLQSVESVDPGAIVINETKDPFCRLGYPAAAADMRNSYADLVQELPAARPMQRLLKIFLESFNWQYGVIEPQSFHSQLDQWQKVPVTVRASAGPENPSLDLVAFPAILFQMMATALLLVSEKPHQPEMDGLLVFGDSPAAACLNLAAKYSEIGTRICTFLGKDALSLTTVQAQILRASFQKFTSDVKGSWHTIAEATRDAQELGMHSDTLDPVAADQSVSGVFQAQWRVQQRRTAYMLLVTWDINMTVFMGRPGITNPYERLPSAPIDTSSPGSVPVTPRMVDSEPPTPLSKSLWIYRIADLLREVSKLQSDGTHPSSWAKVNKIHQNLLDLERSTPAVFRLRQPDTRWDDLPQLDWLRGMRYYLAQMQHFAIMSLHRRYMFQRDQSRAETVKSSLIMLELHKGSFEHLPVSSWRSHMLFFGTFDALVQISTVCILFPSQCLHLHNRLSRHFGWVMDRFAVISAQNASAGAAIEVLKVLRAIVTKAASRVSSTAQAQQQHDDDEETESYDFSAPLDFRAISFTPGHNEGEQQGFEAYVSQGRAGSLETALGYDIPLAISDWPDPDPVLFAKTEEMLCPDNQLTATSEQQDKRRLEGLAPLLPTRDLLFHNISAGPRVGQVGDVDAQTGFNASSSTGEEQDYTAWHFDGEFESDTVWHYLNQL